VAVASSVSASRSAPRVAAYAHTNTGPQDLEDQLAEIRQWVAQRGWELVATYTDGGPGVRADRANFQRLLADTVHRQFDAIVIQRFDRAARSVRELVVAFARFRRCDVVVVSLAEDVDTSTAAGELIFHVMAAIGQFDRALTGDRIRSGLARARAEGVRLGRPPANARPEQAHALRQAGLLIGEIARQLRCSRATVRRRLREVPAPNEADPSSESSLSRDGA
jgi:DNA invertase Pin-like site-specific DNA recombinase